MISAPVAPNNILRRRESGFLSSTFTTDDIVSKHPLPARSFIPQHEVLTSVSTSKAGFPYTADHPKRVLITMPMAPFKYWTELLGMVGSKVRPPLKETL